MQGASLTCRYDDIRKGVETRGQALDSIADATSGLGERLDNFVNVLQGTSDRLHQNAAVTSDPSLLQGQIAENMAIKEGLRAKQAAYVALKESAAELLSSLPPGEFSYAQLGPKCTWYRSFPEDKGRLDVNEKLRRLDDLWKSIEQETNNRGGFLESTLAKAKRFWSELDECQRAVCCIHSPPWTRLIVPVFR